MGVLLRQAREEAGLTQEELAARLETKKSAISRIENHAGDIRLSTLERYAKALGRQLFGTPTGTSQPPLGRCCTKGNQRCVGAGQISDSRGEYGGVGKVEQAGYTADVVLIP